MPPAPAEDPGRPPVASFVSLGCEKNRVDSERILGALVSQGFLLAEDPAEADVCLVNTCGFIQPAREETAHTLAELATLKMKTGRPRLVALGCLVRRVRQKPEFSTFLESADACFDFDDFMDIPALCRALCEKKGEPHELKKTGESLSRALDPRFHHGPRLLTGGSHVVPLKISEGCSNSCRFCSIPAIRGPHVSRPIEDIVLEARDLISSGVCELDVIAQDTTAYGIDLCGRPRLADLLRALAGLKREIWFRLLYAYPGRLDEETLRILAAETAFCPYLDLPLQHISDPILRAMGRPLGRDDTLRFLDRITEAWPGVELRTAFIVGFPGETDRDFEALREVAAQGRFLYAGVFAFSPEIGTPAERLPDPVPESVREERRTALVDTITDATERRLRTYVGKTLPVMIDRRARVEEGWADAPWMGRTRFQAPDVDGVVWLQASPELRPGQVMQARITAARGVDLEGKTVRSDIP